MQRLMIAICLLVGLALPAHAADSIRDSVVKIHSTQRLPDFVRPWTKASPRQISGSGAIIAGNRILTNAHVVMYASRILVQANESTERIPATVEFMAPGIDLAVLKVSDPALFEGRQVLELADGLPRVKEKVNAYGYPIGGEQLSVTEGIISRVEYVSYSYGTMGLRIQVDAAINPGNSGGPGISDGKIVGLVFSIVAQADNIGYLIPAEEIRLFLKDVEDGHYDGKQMLMEHMQTVENSALRARLGLAREAGGLMVTRVTSQDKNYPLHELDVITHVADQPLDKQGNIRVGEELRLSFRYVIPKYARHDKLPLTVFRDGKSVKVEVPLERESRLIIGSLKGTYPPHFIYGPMVFTNASQELLTGLGSRGLTLLAARQNPLVSRRFEHKKQPTDEIVILGARLFPHAISEGYDRQFFGVVTQVNDTKILNLPQLVKTIHEAKGKYLTISIAGAYETLVFDRQQLLDSTDEILENEGIRYQMSEELRSIWSQ